MKEIFENLKNKTTFIEEKPVNYSLEDAIIDCKLILEPKNDKTMSFFLQNFFDLFYDDKKNIVDERTSIIYQLFKTSNIKKIVFSSNFNDFVKKNAWQLISDNPDLSFFLAKIYSPFVENGDLRLSDISFDISTFKIDEDFLDFLLEFYYSLIKGFYLIFHYKFQKELNASILKVNEQIYIFLKQKVKFYIKLEKLLCLFVNFVVFFLFVN